MDTITIYMQYMLSAQELVIILLALEMSCENVVCTYYVTLVRMRYV